ncbi:MAG: hypothetical protein ABFS02_05825 [Pseudomonadota bacterium]
MPEQISKYPQVTLKVLKGAGAVCGEGAEQEILTQCPREQFCSLPTGEVCIFGLDQISQMTQITPEELSAALSQTPKTPSFSVGPTGFALTLFLSLAVGFLIGRLWKRLVRAD